MPEPRLSISQALTLALARREQLVAQRDELSFLIAGVELEERGLRMALTRHQAPEIDGETS